MEEERLLSNEIPAYFFVEKIKWKFVQIFCNNLSQYVAKGKDCGAPEKNMCLVLSQLSSLTSCLSHPLKQTTWIWLRPDSKERLRSAGDLLLFIRIKRGKFTSSFQFTKPNMVGDDEWLLYWISSRWTEVSSHNISWLHPLSGWLLQDSPHTTHYIHTYSTASPFLNDVRCRKSPKSWFWCTVRPADLFAANNIFFSCSKGR